MKPDQITRIRARAVTEVVSADRAAEHCRERGTATDWLETQAEDWSALVKLLDSLSEPRPFGHMSQVHEETAQVCGAHCDHGSECLEAQGHAGAHETQHGCVFYDREDNQKKMTNDHRRTTVILSAWVDPALREHARLEAKRQGVPFSKFVERAVQQAVSRAAVERANEEARCRLECSSCGYAPCGCEQQ